MPYSPPGSPTQPDSQDPTSQLRKFVPSRWTPNQPPYSPSAGSQVEDSQVEEDALAPPSPTPPQRPASSQAATASTRSLESARLFRSHPNTTKATTVPSNTDRVGQYERRILHLEGARCLTSQRDFSRTQLAQPKFSMLNPPLLNSILALEQMEDSDKRHRRVLVDYSKRFGAAPSARGDPVEAKSHVYLRAVLGR
ncbi:hypothetical protein BDN72DRAFT_897464 [Pluteus cervinus]|uniref:Uncharacterized protein n=1 Tax=Pluteus cervinus TaxID=181527 RepID=A0ACD3ATN8_9AGAR|nr:hypothetical protein BDN72DRAFT_897464 [Pluteus cervinus]